MTDINISLEQHLLDELTALIPILPPDIKPDLSLPIIPYSTLQVLSKWTRTTEGTKAVSELGLQVQSYSMIALLAGSTSSPEKKFPPHERARPEQDAKREMNDRKAVVAVANSLLSIGGAGFATWWATGVAGWRDEWKALFAIFVSLVVAIAEGVLFVIWDSRKSKPRRLNAKYKKLEEKQEDIETRADPTVAIQNHQNLRLRK